MSRLSLIEQDALLRAINSTEVASALKKFREERIADSNERGINALRSPNPNTAQALRYAGQADAWISFFSDLEKFADQDTEG